MVGTEVEEQRRTGGQHIGVFIGEIERNKKNRDLRIMGTSENWEEGRLAPLK